RGKGLFDRHLRGFYPNAISDAISCSPGHLVQLQFAYCRCPGLDHQSTYHALHFLPDLPCRRIPAKPPGGTGGFRTEYGMAVHQTGRNRRPPLFRLYRLWNPAGHPGLWADPVLLEARSEEHTSELQSRENLVCRLLLEKKKMNSWWQYTQCVESD